MLYSRKIVLAIAACVVLASAVTQLEQVKNAEAAVKAAKTAHEKAESDLAKVPAQDQTAKTRAEQLVATEKADLDKATATLETARLALNVEKMQARLAAAKKAKAELTDPTDDDTAIADLQVEFMEAWLKQATAAVDLDSVVADADKAAKNALLTTANDRKERLHKYYSAYQHARAARETHAAANDAPKAKAKVDMDLCEATLNLRKLQAAVPAAEPAKITEAEKKLKAAQTAVDNFDMEYEELGLVGKIGHFFKTPYRRYKEKTFGEDGKPLGFFGRAKHMFWPTSTSGYLTAATVVGTVAAGGVGGTYLYNEHNKKKRASSSNTKLAIGAGLLAAAGAAAGGKYAYDQYQAKQQGGEYMGEDVDPDAETSQKADGSPNTKQPGSKKKNGKKSKKSGPSWMLWGTVIVVVLAAIGGAVYYFLFMAEEGSEEDAAPEGEDMV